MKLVIDIHDKKVKILLLENGKEQDSLDFVEENNLSDKLLIAMDELLQRNNLVPENIEKAELKTNLTDNFTTYRIAKAIVNTFNWAKNI